LTSNISSILNRAKRREKTIFFSKRTNPCPDLTSISRDIDETSTGLLQDFYETFTRPSQDMGPRQSLGRALVKAYKVPLIE